MTIRQYISSRCLKITDLTRIFVSAIKVYDHDCKKGREGAFGGAHRRKRGIVPRRNNKAKFRQPPGYYSQRAGCKHLHPRSERLAMAS